MITNEQIQQALYSIEEPTEVTIRESLNELLNENEMSDCHSNGIFNPNTNLFEGVIVKDGENTPIFHFTYDWDGDEYIPLIGE